MKICQEKKEYKKFNKKILNTQSSKNIIFKIVFNCLIFCFIISCVLVSAQDASARQGTWYSENIRKQKDAGKIIIRDPGTEDIIWGQTIEQLGQWAKKFTIDEAQKVWQEKGDVAYKAMLSHFLNTLAYDTATYLATGDEGQSPMFETDDISDYLVNAADSAAGIFLEKLGQGTLQFNLCEPDFNVMSKINLGLYKSVRPGKPECTFSKMVDNWDEELSDPDFLPKFQDMFNPWSNDLGVALSLQTGMTREIEIFKDNALYRYPIYPQFKPVKDPISGKTKSPAATSKKAHDLALEKSIKTETTYTGSPVADAIGIFMNTLIGTLIEEWLKEGLVTEFDEYQPWEYDDYESQATSEGIAGAEDRFRELIEPEFGVRGDYEILGELVSCSDPTKAGPTNCVITENFRQAVINRMTVGQAMNDGYLDANGIFGFTSDGLEPDYYDEGYPYRSMIILRKFRILPVGWELAAQYIKDFSDETLNLSDLVACYDSTDDYDGYYASWCQGLVDPSWVLKAPLNYCKREGPGPEIISEQIIGEGYDSELAISRNDNYCADEQSCIKENNDGSCQLYGYCVEERRRWLFNGNSCEPKYNTCQTFRSRQGSTVSYLENTLDYSICSIDNVGCQPYCADYDYESSDFTCTADAGNKMYFDKDVEDCDSDDEGCHEFIRTKAGIGANLLVGAGYEEEMPGWDRIDIDSYEGQWSIHFRESDLDGYPMNGSIIAGENIIQGEIYTFSLYAKNCGNTGTIGIGSDSWNIDHTDVAFETTYEWQRFEVSHIINSGNEIWVDISNITDNNDCANNNCCLMDAGKVERGSPATAYSNYRESGLVYEKLLPDYLETVCYVNPDNDYRLIDADMDGFPDEPICSDYARKCNQDEVNCEFYTSVADDFSVPAKVIAQDYCPAECAGYDTYIQTETTFNSLRDEYFIPSTAQTCGAEAAGCDEFTNLDEVELGGEGIEYYTYLRQCIKPSDPAADCADFYTWEGSDEAGFQLRAHNLQQDGGEPAVTQDDSGECDESIYYLSAADPAYNSNCREFYNSDGEISYHLYSRTITCDEDCHPYRRTENNVAQGLEQSNCNADGSGYPNVNDDQFFWDTDYEVCYFCKSNGEWSDEHYACIYMAIPGEGVSCSNSQDGCREYSGNAGANMRIVLNNDFEGSLQGWTGINGATAELSSEALMAGGESLYVHGANFTASTIVGGLVQENKSYVLSFIAKSAGANQFNSIQLVNGAGEEIEFLAGNSVSLGGDWQLYEVNLARLGHKVDDGESLVITADGDFYIDDIRLTEITDRYYLIKNSWVTPDSCNQDIYGDPSPLYMLGCDEYQDRDNSTHYLRSFDWLCQESAVGCEILVDTHNYTLPQPSPWQGEGVEADSFVYAVYDQDKKCNQSDKGCQLLGLPYQYGSEVIYEDVYLLNNPDDYDSILCDEDAVGCEEWTSSEGSSYFKDSGDMVCDWRQGYQDSWSWWKKKINRCDDGSGVGTINGIIDFEQENNVCLADSDCDLVAGYGMTNCSNDSDCDSDPVNDFNSCVNGKCYYSCILDNNDHACYAPLDGGKTIGIGGTGNRVEPPHSDTDGNWVGLCPASQAGCSEYIDPVSKFSTNIIFNADFSQDVDNNNQPDGWSGDSQEVKLEPHYLYRLAGKNNDADSTITITCPYGIFRLDENNAWNDISGGASYSISLTNVNEVRSILFYQGYDQTCEVTMDNIDIGGNDSIELKKTVIDYQIKDDLDKATCNGIVDFEEGCVLFNERYQNGFSLAVMDWDADLTINDGDGVSPETGDEAGRNVNALIKVTPDRVCNQWLACRSYIKDEQDNNVCFDIGLCDSVDDNGNCNSFILIDKDVDNNPINQTYPNPLDFDSISNMSGYVKAGYRGSSIKTDYYLLGAMEQVGQVTTVSNGGFEFYGSNNYPIGWNPVDVSWDENKFSVINNPISAQVEGVGYPLEGRSFLKYSPSAGVMESEFIDIEPDIEYVLSAYMNTINFKLNIEDINNGFGSGTITIDTYDNEGLPTNYGATAAADIDYCLHQPLGHGCGIYLPGGNDWTKILTRFKAGAGTAKIKLRLHGNWWFDYTPPTTWESSGVCDDEGSLCIGNVYIDNIKIRPALEVYDSPYTVSIADPGCTYTPDMEWILNRWQVDWIVPQSCRLYPEDDALSCDYYEDSGKRQKGWLGYCLEYDRYPGSSDACLMWWPVDKVNGEGIEEGAGYADRFPLYYSLEGGTEFIDLESNSFYIPYSEPPICTTITLDDLGFDVNEWYGIYFLKSKLESIYLDCTGLADGNNWHWKAEFDNSGTLIFQSHCGIHDESWTCESYEHGGSIPNLPGFDSDTCGGASGNCSVCGSCGNCQKLYIAFDNEDYFNHLRILTSDDSNDSAAQNCILHIKFNRDYAQKIAQVVTPVGQNKYWSGRVYQGSDYSFDCNNGISGVSQVCDYLSDYQPFGSIVPPGDSWSIVVNPYEWDSKDADGVQPLYYELPNEDLSEPYQARMGQLHDRESVKRLFAQSYGTWEWQVSEMLIDPTTIRAAFEWGNKLHILTNDWQLHIADSLSPPYFWTEIGFYDYFPDGGPSVFSIITAAWTAPDNTLYFIDTGGAYYGYNGSSWVNGILAWAGQGGPTNYSAITAAWYYDDWLNVVDNTFWYVYDYSISEWLTPIEVDLTWSDRTLDTAGWNGTDAPAGEDGSYTITATFISGSVLYVVEDNGNWYAIDYNTNSWLPESSSELNYSRAISTAWQAEGMYRPVNGQDWSAPDTICDQDTREASSGDFCAILPKIDNINVNKTEIQNTDFINLTFNSIVDSQQLPLVMYAVDWGDGDKTVVSGVEMRDRSNPDRPHSLYHLYSYWDLKAREASGVAGIDCTTTSGQCSIRPSVKIKDNWGWCNNYGVSGGPCPTGGYQAFEGWIVVKEK